MSSGDKFRVLLVELARSLSKEDVESIVFIYLTPSDMEEQSALQILLKMEMLGKIDPSNPSTVEEVFKEIKRIDLAKRVKDFIKSQRRSKRPPRNTAEGLELSLQANFEVAVLQWKLLSDQLTNLQKVAEQAGTAHVERGISQVREVVAEQVGKRLLELKNDARGFSDSVGSGEINIQPLVPSRRNSFEKELSQTVQRRQARDPESPTKAPCRPPVPPKTKGRVKKPVQEAIPEAETEYAEVGRSQLCALKGMDIGRFASAAPNAPQLQEDGNSGGSDDTLVTGALDKTPPGGKRPLIPRRQQKTQKAKEFNVREDEDDSTAGTTGDSGFADITPFVKVPLGSRHRHSDEDTLPSLQDPSLSSTDETLPSEPAPGYYKSIQREQVAPVSYYKHARGDFQRFQDLIEDPSDPPRMKDSKPQKSTKSRPASSHNTF